MFAILIFLSCIFINEACYCGFSLTYRIYGGSPEQPGEYPWVAVLTNSKQGTSAICAASIISPRYAVTAYHCVSGVSASERKLIVGAYNLERSTEQQHMDIKRFILYQPTNHNDNDDIALIELTRDIRFGRSVQPICLPQSNSNFEGSSISTAVGYGQTESGSGSKNPLVVDLVVPTSQYCNTYFRQNYGGSLPRQQLCAGDPEGKRATCFGDSGGPLMYYDSSYGSWLLIGIVHATYSCKAKYSLFTNVSQYTSWIQQQTETAGCELRRQRGRGNNNNYYYNFYG